MVVVIIFVVIGLIYVGVVEFTVVWVFDFSTV